MRCPTAGYGKGGQRLSKYVGSEKTLFITYIRIHDRKPVNQGGFPQNAGVDISRRDKQRCWAISLFACVRAMAEEGVAAGSLDVSCLCWETHLMGQPSRPCFTTPKRKGWSKYLPSKRNVDLVAAVFTYESEIPSVEGKREGSFFSISLYYFLLPATLPTTRSFVLT